VFSKLQKKTIKHMMFSIGLIALGYITAVCGIHYDPVMWLGLIVMLSGWFVLIRTGHGALTGKR